MKNKNIFAFFSSLLFTVTLSAQSTGVFTDLEKALSHPESVRVIDLSNQALTSIPDTFQLFTQLEEVRFTNNNLQQLPPSLAKVESLLKINLTGNVNLDVEQAVGVLAALPNLESLNMSNCGIMFLPNKISNCHSLKSLTLNSNQILFLPNAIGDLSALEELHLNGNYVNTLPSSFFQLQSLSVLDIAGNEQLDTKQTFEILAKTNVTELHLGGQAIADGLNKLEHITELYFENCEFSAMPNFSKSKLQTLDLRNCKGLDADSLMLEVAQIGTLRHFTFQDNQLTSISLKPFHDSKIEGLKLELWNLTDWNKTLYPLTLMAGLHNLDLSDNTIETFPRNLNNCDSLTSLNMSRNQLDGSVLVLKNQRLEFLNLSHNEIEEKEISILAQNLPNCTIKHDFINPKVLAKQIPHPDIKPDIETFEWRGEEPKVIVLQSGTTFNIPEQAFVNAQGEPVSGPIKFQVEEFKTVKEIFASGIPMTYDSAGTSYNFKSGGMLEIRAFQNNEELKLDLNKKIGVTMASISRENFNVYNLNDSTGAWMPAATRTATANVMVQSGAPSYQLLDSLAWYNRNNRWPSPVQEVLIFGVKRFVKLNTFVVYVNKPKNSNKRRANKIYSEANDLSAHEWIYEGQNWEQDFELLKRFTSAMREKYRYSSKDKTYPTDAGSTAMLTDFYIKPNPKSDNFILTLIFEGEVYEFPVAINSSSKKPKLVQKQYNKFYGIYARNYKARFNNWHAVDSSFEADRKQNLASLWNDLKATAIDSNGQMYIPRPALSFDIGGLGIINCDMPLPKIPDNPMMITRARFKSPSGENIKEPAITYVLDYTNNSAYRYRKGTPPSIYKKSYSLIIIELTGKKRGLVRYNQIKNAIDNNSKKPEFVFEEYENVDALMEALHEKVAVAN